MYAQIGKFSSTHTPPHLVKSRESATLFPIFLLLLNDICVGTTARADELLGQTTSVGPASAAAALDNPAQAAFLRRYELEGRVSPYSSNSFVMTYPGSDSTKLSHGGFGLGGTNLALGTPLGELCGMSFIGFPPGLKGKVSAEKLPVFIMGQKNETNLKGEGELLGSLNLGAGCELAPHFSMGIGMTYQGMKGSAVVFTPANNTEIVSVKTEQKSTNISIGWKYLIDIFTFGGSIEALSLSQGKTAINAPLLGDANNNNLGGNSSGRAYLNKYRAGLGVHFAGIADVYADVTYYPLKEAGKAFSPVDFTEKPVDKYSTTTLGLGVRAPLFKSNTLLSGFHYSPASLGAGGRGAGSKTGFNMIQANMIYAGTQDLEPSLKFAFGIESVFGNPKNAKETQATQSAVYKHAESTSKTTARREARSPAHQPLPPPREKKGLSVASETSTGMTFVLTGGIVYQRASLGIDESGEQPGAYDQVKISIPIGIRILF